MATDIISAYRSVCRDLAGLQAYAPIVKRKLEAAHGVMYKGRMPSSGSICYVPLDTAIPMFNETVEEYNETMKTIEQLEMVKEQLEKTIAKMSEAEQIIVLLHVEQGLNLREIAEMSHYSYGHLKNVSRRIRSNDVTESANAS